MDEGSKGLSVILFKSQFPRLMDTLSECHVTSLHYASPSPVQRVDRWRPLWGIHGGRHTHLAPSEHRQHLSLPLHLVVAGWGDL